MFLKMQSVQQILIKSFQILKEIKLHFVLLKRRNKYFVMYPYYPLSNIYTHWR